MIVVLLSCALLTSLPACQSTGGAKPSRTSASRSTTLRAPSPRTTPTRATYPRTTSSRSKGSRAVAIMRIACLYDQRPWLNLDDAGDRDPEGIWFRAYLDPGIGRGVLAEGTFHIEMYLIERLTGEQARRTLMSDWHYPSTSVAQIAKPGMLGEGYVFQLRWADKGVAGQEVEFVTRFEDAFGNVVRSGTKRLRVPKYES